MIELTKEQKGVVEDITDHVFAPTKQEITVGGYAGTGKTTVLGYLSHNIRKVINKKLAIAFCTFTGKASSVLKEKLNDVKALLPQDSCSTIHSLIYRPKMQYSPKLKKMVLIGWELINADDFEYDLIIVDEASMVNETIWQDLKSLEVSIVVVGDHGQLPPVGGKFNLMEKPELTLVEVHRQARENPIIALSMMIRRGGHIPYGFFDGQNSYTYNTWNELYPRKAPNVLKLDWDQAFTKEFFHQKIKWDEGSVIALCGFNKSRVSITKMIRAQQGFTMEEPYPGEKVICLKNNRDTKLMNGQIGQLVFSLPFKKNVYNMTIKIDGSEEMYNNLVLTEFFNKDVYKDMFEKCNAKAVQKIIKGTKEFNSVDPFDFGYCVSVHRSQGSEWDRVVLFEQRTRHWDDEYYARWLYTGVTRAREKLLVIQNYW